MKYYFCKNGLNATYYAPKASSIRIAEHINQADTVSTIDVLALAEIIEAEGEMEFRNPALLMEMKAFVEDQKLVLFDGEEMYKIPLGEVIGIRKINQGIPVVGEWNKKVPPSAKKYQNDGIILWRNDCIGLQFFYALEILHLGEIYRLIFPAYELNKLRHLTSQAGLLHNNSLHSGSIKPKFYWNIPKGASSFFLPNADITFKMRHPMAYKVLVAVGIIVLLLPQWLYLFLAIKYIPRERQNYWMAIGYFGSFILGFGNFNLVGAWVKQYLGHWVTIISYLIGAGIIGLSVWIQLGNL